MNMRQDPRHFAALAACLATAWMLGLEWEAKLTPPHFGRDLLRAQSSREESFYTSSSRRTEKGTSQRIYREGQTMKARYSFINFNRDSLTVTFAMTTSNYKKYLKGYGYTDNDMARLKIWRDSTRQEVWENTYRRSGRIAAEKAVAEVDMDYDTKLRALLRRQGLAMRAGNVVEADMPVVIRKNKALMTPLARAFQKVANSRGYSEEELVGAVVSMVQTAIRYKVPRNLENGLHTCGLLPPARALLSGWGDCDTKTGVLASILSNWSKMRMVGVAVPGHYLMAIRRLPAKGDMFIRHKGLEYVLVEPAGPAWLEPGMVGRTTKALLAGREGYRLEPFF